LRRSQSSGHRHQTETLKTRRRSHVLEKPPSQMQAPRRAPSLRLTVELSSRWAPQSAMRVLDNPTAAANRPLGRLPDCFLAASSHQQLKGTNQASSRRRLLPNPWGRLHTSRQPRARNPCHRSRRSSFQARSSRRPSFPRCFLPHHRCRRSRQPRPRPFSRLLPISGYRTSRLA
jgi:hypothetical protein